MTTGSLTRTPAQGALQGFRQNLRTIRAALRNPLDGLPPEIFHQPIIRRPMFHRDITYLMDPALVHEALVTHNDKLDKGESVQRLLRPALGNGLLTAEGADWRWQRRAIAPVFRAGGLARFQPSMTQAAERARDRLLALPPGETVAVNTEMMRVTFDIIVETMLSGASQIDVDATATAVTEYLHNVGWANLANVLGLPEWVPHPGKRKSRAAAARLQHALTATVADRRRARQPRNDLIDTLLQAADPETGRQMTDQEITDNLLTFLTAGHETTALGLAWTLDLLGRHPDIADRVHQEAVAIGPNNPDALTYTRQVFQEGLRLYPAAPLIVRRVTAPFTLGGIALQPGVVLIIPIHAIHRHAALWDDPQTFNPDRFAPEAARDRSRYSYMPFGAGPRICIGATFALQEATTVLATLLQHLRFTNAQPTPPKPRMEITLRPSQPLLMRLERLADRRR